MAVFEDEGDDVGPAKGESVDGLWVGSDEGNCDSGAVTFNTNPE